MAVPAIILGAAGILALAGVKNGASALDKNARAKNLSVVSQAMYDRAKTKAEKARKESNDSLEKLGHTKMDVLNNSMSRFVDVFEQLHSIELSDSAGLNELSKFKLEQKDVLSIRELSSMAASMAKGLAGGTAAGAMAAFGAYSATMSFAAASTGTAIASLSGAAATNATLAFLGGGAVYAGGGGMALGSVALGGAVAGPAIAILGVVMNANATKNLENAFSSKAQAEKLVEEIKTVGTACNAIAGRAKMFTALLKKLDVVLAQLTAEMQNVIARSGTDYSRFSRDEKNIVQMALSVAKATESVIGTAILNEDGSMAEESAFMRDEIIGCLKSIDSKSCNDLPSETNTVSDNEEIISLLKEKAQKCFKDAGKYLLDNSRVLSNIIYQICHGDVKKEEILNVWDGTITGNGKRGLVITTKGIFHNEDDNLHTNYSSIIKVERRYGFASGVDIYTPDGRRHYITDVSVDADKLKSFLEYAMALYEEG